MLLRGAHDRESPATRADDSAELAEEGVDLLVGADGVAADERGSCHDAVGEKGAARRREEVALVAPQREEGEAVAAIRVHERPCRPPLADRLRDGLTEGPEPEVEGCDAERDAESGERVGGAVRQVGAAPLLRA